jgi:hypothetical protein
VIRNLQIGFFCFIVTACAIVLGLTAYARLEVMGMHQVRSALIARDKVQGGQRATLTSDEYLFTTTVFAPASVKELDALLAYGPPPAMLQWWTWFASQRDVEWSVAVLSIFGMLPWILQLASTWALRLQVDKDVIQASQLQAAWLVLLSGLFVLAVIFAAWYFRWYRFSDVYFYRPPTFLPAGKHLFQVGTLVAVFYLIYFVSRLAVVIGATRQLMECQKCGYPLLSQATRCSECGNINAFRSTNKRIRRVASRVSACYFCVLLMFAALWIYDLPGPLGPKAEHVLRVVAHKPGTWAGGSQMYLVVPKTSSPSPASPSAR